MRLFENNLRLLPSFAILLGLLAGLAPACAQDTATRQYVHQVIQNEIAASENDHSHWMFRDTYKSPEKNIVKLVLQTKQASLSKTIESNGRPLTAEEQQADRARMEKLVHDPAARARQQKASAHDDQQAASLMKMLPEAFLWTRTGEANGDVTLRFRPNPAFNPPTYASRVFAAMAGEMVVDARQKRVKILSGKLIQPVEFGWGLFGKMEQGGTFRVLRTELAPGVWEITETHVHIQGHALFFKSIGDQEDDVSTDYKPAPQLTLEQAAKMLTTGAAEEQILGSSAR